MSDASRYEFPLFRDAQVRTAAALAVGGATILAAYERTTRGEAAGGVPRTCQAPVEPPKTRSGAISR